MIAIICSTGGNLPDRAPARLDWPRGFLTGRQDEGLGLDPFCHGAAAKALRTDQHRFIGPLAGGDPDLLEIWPELPPGNPGQLGSDSAEILGFTTGLYPVAHLGPLTANLTAPRHRITPQLSLVPRFQAATMPKEPKPAVYSLEHLGQDRPSLHAVPQTIGRNALMAV